MDIEFNMILKKYNKLFLEKIEEQESLSSVRLEKKILRFFIVRAF